MHPTLFHLGPLTLPTFGALLALGLMGALLLSLRTAPLAGLPPDRLWHAGLFAVLAAFVSSRVLLAVEHPRILVRYPLFLLTQPSLTAAGLLLAVAATLIFLQKQRLPLRRVLDAWTPCGLLLWAFLALGHFFEGSDPGMPTEAPWGVRFPGESLVQQPVALLTSCAALVLGALTLLLLRRGSKAAASGLAGAGLAQALIGFVRQPGPTSIAGLEPLAWVSLALLAIGGLLFLQNKESVER